MRARKRLAAILVAGALSAPFMVAAPANAQLLDLGGLLGGTGALGGLLGSGANGGLAGVLGGTGALQGLLGGSGGILSNLIPGSLLNGGCGLSLSVLNPNTCTAASPATLATNPLTGLGSLFGSGLGTIPTGFGGFPTTLGTSGFPQVIQIPTASTQPMVITNNNSSNSTSSAVASATPGGGASASANGNSGSTQSQTIVIP